MKKYICIIILLLAHAAYSAPSNTIKVTNLEVLYEKDAHIQSPLPKDVWQDIDCPESIDSNKNLADPSHCICLQDNGWIKIKSLSELKLHSPDIRNVNYIWIKGSFNIDDDPKISHGIYMEYLMGRSVVYINNRLVDIKDVSNQRNLLGSYLRKIPDNLLVRGTNKVYMRLEIITTQYNGAAPDIFILPDSVYAETAFRHGIRYALIKDILFFIIIILFGYSTIQAIVSKDRFIYVLSSLSTLYLITLAMLTVMEISSQNLPLYYLFRNSSPNIVALSFIVFFQILYGFKLNRKIFLYIIFIVLCAVGYMLAMVNCNQKIHEIALMANLMICFLLISNVLFTLNKRRPKQKKFYLFLSIVIMYIAGMTALILSFIPGSYIPGLSFFMFNPNDILYLLYFSILPAYGIVYSISEKIKKERQQEELYNRLIEKNNKSRYELTITDASEEKLKSVIAFINENYKENLSREGLAAAIDMNPNYLSSLFNKYTGKKIQEYIDTLRIEEAAKVIRDTDIKIIDVAYSVGFENLTTFLRKFKKELGKTPKEFREDMYPSSGGLAN